MPLLRPSQFTRPTVLAFTNNTIRNTTSIIQNNPTRLNLQTRSASHINPPTTDQTKENNDATSKQESTRPKSGPNSDATKDHDHPMKEPDPQESPESTTGIQRDGPGGSKAGKGKEPTRG